MHGTLFLAFRRFLTDRYGASIAKEVFGDGDKIDTRRVYPDATFDEFITRGVQLTRSDPERLLRDFGTHAIATFYELYPSYFPSEGARRFLTQLPALIFARVKELTPDAAPPKLEVTDLGSGRLRIEYQSPRKLCSMLSGLLDGTGAHYQTSMRKHEERCMRRGDASCVFDVSVQQTLLPRSAKKK